MSGGVPAGEIAKERADWLLDAVAAATQDRRYLRGDPEYNECAGEAILLNGEKAILVAIDRATPTPPIEGRDADVERVEREAQIDAVYFAWNGRDIEAAKRSGQYMNRHQAASMVNAVLSVSNSRKITNADRA